MIRLSLQTRIAATVALIAIGFSIAGYAINRRTFYDEFVALERKEAIDDLRRCEDAVTREIEHLDNWCGDWGAWEEAYTFVGDGNETFANENITDEVLRNVKINAVWYVRANGDVVRHRTLDFAGTRSLSFPELPADRFPLGHPLLPTEALDRGVNGILRTAAGPLLVASRPVVHADLTGPAAGWFICGRLLDDHAVAALAEQAHVSFRVWDVDDPKMEPHAAAAVRSAAESGEPTTDDASDEILHIARTMDDTTGRPGIVISADVPRDISIQGATAMRVASTSTAVAGGLTVAILLALLSMTVVAPILRLTEHAAGIGRNADLSARSGIVRGDEIGSLAAEFDRMVERLAESRNLLTETARHAGMADVARGVLHNVGNVLTSVNVSALNIVGTLKQSRAEGLVKGLDLMNERRQDLATYLAEDACGKLLPEYLTRAAVALREERATMLDEAEKMRTAIAHAAEIVARQGEFASARPLTELIQLDVAIGAAAALVEPAFRRHSVVLAKHVDRDASITADRTKLTQILVNLLTNAKEALASREVSQRRVNLRACRAGEHIRIRIEDNGCGLSAEQVARAFERGFSTKKDGRGFGLHYCAVTAREMGGSLNLESDGPGLGATFVLELPVSASPARHDTPTAAVGSPS